MGAAPAPGIAVTGLWKKVGRLFTGGAVDTVKLEAVQRMLVEADFGVAATNETVEKLSRADTVDQASLERIIVEELGPAATPLARAAEPPTVIVIFGVNGTGKTTSVAKLAKLLQREGRSVLLAAADTFRAGATEQLKVWADRLNAPFVGASHRGDPAAVAFDAVEAATTRGVDTVLWTPRGGFIPMSGCAKSSRRLCASWESAKRGHRMNRCSYSTPPSGRTRFARRRRSPPRSRSPVW